MDRNTPLYDPRLTDRERAEYLVSRLTIEEKFAWFGLRIRNERLGLAVSTCGGEGAHGVQARAGQGEMHPPTPTTSFTQPIGMAASFDKELIYKAGDVTGKESRAFANAVSKGGHCRLAPTVDMCRDPRWGRNEEGYGEDPYLTGKMASAYIRGMQDEHNYDGTPVVPGDVLILEGIHTFYDPRVRDMLDSLNISERLFFPGLDGLSKWIARHYYVK